jgi:hypothetical protein
VVALPCRRPFARCRAVRYEAGAAMQPVRGEGLFNPGFHFRAAVHRSVEVSLSRISPHGFVEHFQGQAWASCEDPRLKLGGRVRGCGDCFKGGVAARALRITSFTHVQNLSAIRRLRGYRPTRASLTWRRGARGSRLDFNATNTSNSATRSKRTCSKASCDSAHRARRLSHDRSPSARGPPSRMNQGQSTRWHAPAFAGSHERGGSDKGHASIQRRTYTEGERNCAPCRRDCSMIAA